MASPVTHVPTVIRTYLRDGEDGLAALADRLETEAHDRPGGKFGKREALYLPQAPLPPTLWRTSCGRCRFWEEGEPGVPGRCHIVGRRGDPFGGDSIHYRGTCGFWTPPEGEPPLAWVRERLRPDGKSSVRGEYDPELTAKERRRQAKATPTEPDASREAMREQRGADDDRGPTDGG